MDESLKAVPFLTHFSKIPDARVPRTRRHALPDLLFVCICAVICGCNDCVAIADFAKYRLAWLRLYVPLTGGAPSHDTISRVLRLIDPAAFEKAFLEWIGLIREKTVGEVIAIDGKVMRGSFDKATGLAAIDRVSAWASTNGLVLGQVKMSDKSNEITAIPKLLAMLDIKGCLITIDAIGTQKKIAEQIVGQRADYVLPVKENQPALLADLQASFERNMANQWQEGDASEIAYSFHKTFDADHGRQEARRCWCTSYLEGVTEASKWKALQTIILMERQRDKDQEWERRYFITSRPADARTIMNAIRTHWEVENKLHWSLDVNFREDSSRTRKDNGPQIRAMLNRVPINLCKSCTTIDMATSRKRNRARSETNFLQEIITNKPNN